MSEAHIRRLNEALEGRYRVERQIGEGGMATVYLAEDLKHHRHVALKVLKPQLAAQVGAERFLSEIEVTAHLQHPRILALYDSGEADGFLYYVMPFVEGESLRDRLGREHQLALDEAVSIATAVAGALEHAHGHGVVHRDIKPANILLQSGEPVVADFGIALAVGAGAGERLTETGATVGTAHYMSPEQATGDTFVGPATDIYALGCVLYEMLVGEPPYTGASIQAILGKIITSQPVPAIRERPAVPPHVDAVIRRALEKIPADRFKTAASMAAALKDESFRHGSPVGAREKSVWRSVALAALVAVATLVVALAWTWDRSGHDGPASASRVRVAMAEGQELLGELAISPDGATWAYVGPGDGGNRLWVKRRTESRATPLVGTEGARYPFFSPDGLWIGYRVGSSLRKIGVDGSGALTLSDEAASVGEGAWLPDGSILFRGADDALRRVPVVGGATTAILTPGDLPDHARVHSIVRSHDDRYVVLTAVPPGGALEGVGAIWLLDVATGAVAQLAERGRAFGVTPEGILIYRDAPSAVYAARLSLGPEAGLGPAVPVAEGVAFPFAWSAAGTLLYTEAGGEGATNTLVRVDRSGGSEQIVDSGWNVDIQSIALSPDGRRLAAAIRNDKGEDLWVKQLDRGPATRLTSSPGLDRRPWWSPDGTRILFSSDRGETRSLYSVRVDGVGEPELALAVDGQIDQGLWTPDGEWMIYRVGATAGVRDIFARRLSGDSATIVVSADPQADEDSPAISPDGRWIAYVSDESGTGEVYVRPFPNTQEQRIQVSPAGGVAPVWSPDGTELFFVSDQPEGLTSAFVSTEPSFSVDSTVLLYPPGNFILDNRHARYLTEDGQSFMLVRRDVAADGRRDLVLVEGLLHELRERIQD